MAERIHIVVDAAEKARFRAVAARAGKSLSGWLRDAAREKLAAAEMQGGLDTQAALRAFFEACDRRESGIEPDWAEHREVIERSRSSGASRT